MESLHLKTLRNRSSSTPAFRRASRVICASVVRKVKNELFKQHVDSKDIVLVFVLRSALAFLDESLKSFPSSRVAFTGLRRDEHTAEAHWYYENIPPLTKKNTFVIFDPMLATGGSAEKTLQKLLSLGANPRKIYFASVIAAPEGIQRISQLIPHKNCLSYVVDKGLDAKKFIVPGLGDFGDRFFGS